MNDKEFVDGIKNYLEGIVYDYDPQEIRNIEEILEESNLNCLSQLDNDIMCRIIDDEELINEIEKRTEKQETNNVFD